MKFVISALLMVGLCAVMLPAQQPNTANATMRINGASGPPYPITGVQLPRGLSQNVVIQGVPNAPFATLATLSLLPSGVNSPGGKIDIDLSSGYVTVFDGARNTNHKTDPSGQFTRNVLVPASATIGSQAAFQTVIADPASTAGLSLTAASEVQVVQGLTIVPISFSGSEPGRPGTLFSLSTYSLSFPFYNSTYTRMYVNSDGHVSFSGNDSDFTPTPAEFRSGPSRVAPFWTDLDPNFGGSVTVTINQTPLQPFPLIRVDWNNMAEWNNSGAKHKFAVELTATIGDIKVIHDPFNPAMSTYDQLMGITPGNNLLPPGGQWSAQKDLSQLPINPIQGAALESFWEWFGLPWMTYYTPTFSNPFDMTGTTTRFIALSPGTQSAAYLGT